MANDLHLCKLDPNQFYYATAVEEDRLNLIEFAVDSNKKFNARTVPLNYIK